MSKFEIEVDLFEQPTRHYSENPPSDGAWDCGRVARDSMVSDFVIRIHSIFPVTEEALKELIQQKYKVEKINQLAKFHKFKG